METSNTEKNWDRSVEKSMIYCSWSSTTCTALVMNVLVTIHCFIVVCCFYTIHYYFSLSASHLLCLILSLSLSLSLSFSLFLCISLSHTHTHPSTHTCIHTHTSNHPHTHFHKQNIFVLPVSSFSRKAHHLPRSCSSVSVSDSTPDCDRKAKEGRIWLHINVRASDTSESTSNCCIASPFTCCQTKPRTPKDVAQWTSNVSPL